ncbi:hypothetical protein [Paenisporosarcina antarctica]|uniref:Uncharacterized protein n=1 Tax=Paenisporosarcina antarctica TaxID=417367 RepID=A0A4P6ZW57_9BACL|nr:hypothetical protein [Paenisporosarcina antarctica]QBP40288.1 hypothetical protein E2636_03595 [Paenisporosarcina antarctica]
MRFITWGAIGATIFGVVRGIQNGTFQQMMKNMPTKLNAQNLQQMAQPMQGMAQGMQNMAKPMQGMPNNPKTENSTKQQGY